MLPLDRISPVVEPLEPADDVIRLVEGVAEDVVSGDDPSRRDQHRRHRDYRRVFLQELEQPRGRFHFRRCGSRRRIRALLRPPRCRFFCHYFDFSIASETCGAPEKLLTVRVHRMKSRPSRAGVPASPPPKKEEVDSIWRRHGLIVAALCALILAANINSFQGGFPFDNRAAIVMDARIRDASPENLHSLLTQDYWPKQISGLYRPLTSLTYLFNYTILGSGVNPAGYHWFNLILHMVNAGLVYFLGR